MTDPKVDLIKAATDLARDLESILHIGRRMLGDDRDIKASPEPTTDGAADQLAPAAPACSRGGRRGLEEYMRETTGAMYGRQPQEAPFVELPRLTDRELWLMTQAYRAAREPSSPRSIGEWLSERKTVVEPHSREPISATRNIGLALRATRSFGRPGQTPEARS